MLPSPSRRGFSLLELLVVMAILAILTSISVPAVEAMLKGSRLTISARAVVDELNLAQQTAISRNVPVEVRLYKLPDRPGSSGPAKFRALQCFHNDGTDRPLGKMVLFPAGVIVADSSSFSSLLLPQDGPLSDPSLKTGTVSLPSYGTSYEYLSFRFRGNGETDLNSTVNGAPVDSFVTLVSEQDPPAAGQPPKNFVTIQIDPVNGRTRWFRP